MIIITLQWMQSFDNKLLHQLDFQDEQLVIVRTNNMVTSSHSRADTVSYYCLSFT